MDDSCAVCAETLEWVAYGPCGHKDALGDYTRNIGDFSVFPTEVKDGRVGSYWYHEDTQAFFDDLDHYKMIKAMCRLSCSECDKMDEQPIGGSRRRARFRNIDQLKGHLFHQHKLIMCGLCLEGRKVFICEQKLYTRAQLNQHINTGDSELEHYTCHICQRQHPGQYEYYKNYDDLEMGLDHFLCEDEACLAKKFIVFQSESEMKIPTSFDVGLDEDHFRAQMFRDNSENELSMAIQASLQMANSDGRVISGSSSSSRPVLDHRETANHRTAPSTKYFLNIGWAWVNSTWGPHLDFTWPELPPLGWQNLYRVANRLLVLWFRSFGSSVIASAPNLVQNGSFPSTSDFPPVSAVQLRKTPGSSQTMPKVEDVHTANKSLVERIQTYLVYVEQFGLSHLVTELARLCPDPGKQTELVETYKANLVMNVSQSNSWNNNTNLKESSKTSKKGKGKSVDTRNNTSRADLEDNFLRTVRELQVGYNHAEKDAEVLSKDGYRDANDKVKLVIDKSNAGGTSSGESSKLKGQTNSLDVNGGSSQMAINNGKGKQRKKTSKFHRLRLGEESAQAIINQENSESDQDTDSKDIGPKGHDDTTGALPVRGVWRNSGGQKLFTSTGKGSKQ
ncbi:hypothetical protein Leryth_005261 [Lithospermum erythrorhizon]|nr:hypothetical protein Leryth_005261 [Lithospermum erythrorhizon]